MLEVKQTADHLLSSQKSNSRGILFLHPRLLGFLIIPSAPWPNNSAFPLPAPLSRVWLWHRNYCPGQFPASAHSCSAHTGDRTGSEAEPVTFRRGDKLCIYILTSPSPSAKSHVLAKPSPKSNKRGKGELGLWFVSKFLWATHPTP